MIPLAYLGHRLKGQLSGNPEGLANVDVVWQGTDVSQLSARGLAGAVSVLVVELESLGHQPAEELEGLRRDLSPELTLVLHHYAKRELLRSILAENTRTLQAPVSLAVLRSQMLSLIVRDMLTSNEAARPAPHRNALTKVVPNKKDPPGTKSNTRRCPQCGAPWK